MQTRNFFFALAIATSSLASLAFVPLSPDNPTVSLKRSTASPAPKDLTGLAVATFAGGCFWSNEETFEEVRGVTAVVSGYAGGTVKNPSYEDVASQRTGHAESVQVYYNPKQITYQQLLDVFFLGAHNPTELNRQGPDTGPEYRSVAFYRSPQEKQLIEATIKRIDASHHYDAPIVTQVAPYTQFWAAEDYHQGYYRLHPTQGYIDHVSRPKVEKFRKAFPNLLKPAEVL
ncbi:peptide-methionine (S)-S-oxide reductase MsrA [Hymenobacter sp. BT491]|uniref:peptide-methionine (S)-S-oxide reductase MsrA n=1 Tax=Hymenobacter sp. BT491 TaxID=2766779 RepID=UPI001653B1C0|nr:peptide-methionine (S)-S-oxide reductase MsrA [Hymenobacter sp. BT491]MBC6988414.1 peptide-methionine (S)-S-oxide reductase MsrA [Hymenobacter sp. BT491]